MSRNQRVGMRAAAFFAAEYEGGSMTDAMRATGLAYNTVRAIAGGKARTIEPLRKLEEWSRTVPAAVKAGVYIDASMTAFATAKAG